MKINKYDLYTKCVKIINSCTVYRQLVRAERYVEYASRYMDNKLYQDLILLSNIKAQMLYDK